MMNYTALYNNWSSQPLVQAATKLIQSLVPVDTNSNTSFLGGDQHNSGDGDVLFKVVTGIVVFAAVCFGFGIVYCMKDNTLVEPKYSSYILAEEWEGGCETLGKDAVYKAIL